MSIQYELMSLFAPSAYLKCWRLADSYLNHAHKMQRDDLLSSVGSQRNDSLPGIAKMLPWRVKHAIKGPSNAWSATCMQ